MIFIAVRCATLLAITETKKRQCVKQLRSA